MLLPSYLARNWDKSGKAEIVKLCRAALSDVKNKQQECQKLFHQMIWSAVIGQAQIADIASLLQDIVCDDVAVISLLADVATTIDIETICLDDRTTRDNFLTFLASLDNTVPEGVLKERLDPETLEAAQVIQNSKQFNQKLVRTKTKLFYKQQKFNLLREESEGYAKLITELNSEHLPMQDLTHMLQHIKSLLGYFNLDPNRVLDILLESFERQVHEEEYFVKLLSSYLQHCDVSGFCHLVGFKFQYYYNAGEVATPTSLYRMTSLLLKHDLLELEKIYPHLMLPDHEVIQSFNKKVSSIKEEARKLTAVMLSDKKEDDENPSEDKMSELRENQKFGLCEAMLDLGCWTQACEMIDRLPEFCLVSEPTIARALARLVHYIIEPIYRSKFAPKTATKPAVQTSTAAGSKKGFPPACETYAHLIDHVYPMLSTLGAYLSVDPILFVKIGRVLKGFLKEYNHASETLKDKWRPVWAGLLTVIDEVLFPALSVLECNCAIADEMWGLLKRLPYEIRYHLYSNWKGKSYNIHPLLELAKAKTIKRAKYITKRLTKENVKPSGRQIGKLSHNNPCILFDHLLSQIERYDNFIGPMVDALKYLNPLAYDVLAYCIIEALANPEKQRMKQSDTSLSNWLQSLAMFCGAVFKKYPTEITGLLQYIANQMKAGKSLDLLVLKEVVQKMTGVESSDEITQPQLEALAGGDLLKSEGAYFGQIRNTRKPSIRLRDALMEGQLTIPLCLLIAQQRNGVVYVEDISKHLKLLGKLYDQCQDNLIQFGGFLTQQLTTHNYQSSLPSLDELHRYGITPDVSFFLTRPIYKFQIQTRISAIRQTLVAEASKTYKQKQQDFEKQFAETCDDIFRPVVEAAIPLHSPKMWNNLSPLLYVSFWTMSMYDLYSPVERYDFEMTKLQTAIKDVDDNKELNSSSKKKKEKERCQALIDKLKEEMQMQLEHNKLIKKWLETRKDAWFPSKLAKGETITQFLQLCIFPRCVFSAIDAIYCAKFIQTIHTLQAPNFSTLICFDRIFSDVSYIVASLTENESSRYGRFLHSMLQMVMRWHGNKKLYEDECAKYPGFLTILRATNSDKASYLDFENYRHVCHKWQYKITKAVVVCLESSDFTQIRNTITVLIKILPYYPQVKNLSDAVKKRVDKIIEEEKVKRNDLYCLAVGYNGKLKQKTDQVPENVFHMKEKPADKAAVKTEVKTTVKVETKTTIKTEPLTLRKEDSVPLKSTETTKVKLEKTEKLDKAEKSEKPERVDKPDKPERTERPDKSEKYEAHVARAEREKNLADDERRPSNSPKSSSGTRSTEELSGKEKVRSGKDKKDKDHLRSNSPLSSEPEDSKKRKIDDEDFHSAGPSGSGKKDPEERKVKDKLKIDRKRVSTDPEGKDTKRKREENDSEPTSSEQKPKKDKEKKSKKDKDGKKDKTDKKDKEDKKHRNKDKDRS